MVFSSIEFIFMFFPLFILTYYAAPAKYRNIVIFLGSICFYIIGSISQPEYIFLLLVSMAMNYLIGRLLGQYNSRVLFFIGVGCNVLYLVIFKYWMRVFPIGISFYTFQAISYLCDVKIRKCSAEKSFVDFGTYLCMFPQLIAGPIVQYPEIQKQIHERTCSLHNAVRGLQIFVMGLGSKVILANRVGVLWTQLSTIGYESVSTPLAWMGLFAYTFQIYFDFWGYSLMAIGLGKMMGFDLPKNFDNPYLATSMTEFWRSWHITLGSWFREYVYIPLGGNRGSRFNTYRNLFVVWLLTGIWHGASRNFALWGVLLFLLIAVEKAGLKKWLDKYKLLGHLYMLLVIPLSWAVFAHNQWGKMILFFQRLFGWENTQGIIFRGDYLKYGKEYLPYLLLCVLFSTRLPQKIWARIRATYIGQLIPVAIFIVSVTFLYLGLDNPFLYYQF